MRRICFKRKYSTCIISFCGAFIILGLNVSITKYFRKVITCQNNPVEQKGDSSTSTHRKHIELYGGSTEGENEFNYFHDMTLASNEDNREFGGTLQSGVDDSKFVKTLQTKGDIQRLVETLQTMGDNQNINEILRPKGDKERIKAILKPKRENQRFDERLQLKINNQRSDETLQMEGDSQRVDEALQQRGDKPRFAETRQSEKDGRGFQAVTNDGSLHAYSAYYDPRDDPQIRVFVISTQVFMSISYDCQVELETGKKHNVQGTFYIIKTFLTYKYKYVSGVIKCPLKTCCGIWDKVVSVSIYPSMEDLRQFQQNLTIPLETLTIKEHKLSVIHVNPGPRTNHLTRCFAALHSNYSRVHKLIWNIEISRLSGADKFIFYNFSISPEVDKVLRHYMNEGIVEVRHWNLPARMRRRLYYYGQMVAEHDCLMSQMFAAKYVLLADLDEIILPHNRLSIVEMADNIFKYHTAIPKTNLGSLAIRCFLFMKSNDDEKLVPSTSHDLTEAKRLQIEPLVYTRYFIPWPDARKALVIPERTDRMCVHNACFLRKGFKEKTLKSGKEGVLLHFRDSPRHLKPNSTFYEFHDLSKYSNVILAAVTKRKKLLNS